MTSLAAIQRMKSRPCWTSTFITSLWARRACLPWWALSRMRGGSAPSWWSSAARSGIWSGALRTPGSSHHASRTPALQQWVSDRKCAALQNSAGSLLRYSAPPLHSFTTSPTWSRPYPRRCLGVLQPSHSSVRQTCTLLRKNQRIALDCNE